MQESWRRENMFRTARNLVRGSKKSFRAAQQNHSPAHSGDGNDRVVVWLSGHKFTLRVEDWMRGH